MANTNQKHIFSGELIWLEDVYTREIENTCPIPIFHATWEWKEAVLVIRP